MIFCIENNQYGMGHVHLEVVVQQRLLHDGAVKCDSGP